MAAGLQVFNDNNKLQIDENYSNYRLIQRGEMVANTAVYDSQYPSVHARLSYQAQPGSSPILAVRCQDGGSVGIHFTLREGNTFIFFLAYDTKLNSTQFNFVFYIFDITQPPAQVSSYGMQVFNAQGEIIFDGGLQYMWPTSIWNRGQIDGVIPAYPPQDGWGFEQGVRGRFLQMDNSNKILAVAIFSGERSWSRDWEMYTGPGGSASYQVYRICTVSTFNVTSSGMAWAIDSDVWISTPSASGPPQAEQYPIEGIKMIGIINVTPFA